MSANFTIYAPCPYCKFRNEIKVEVESYTHNNATLITCDLMDGGCDKTFVLEVSVKVSSKTYKIDKEEYKNSNCYSCGSPLNSEDICENPRCEGPFKIGE